MPASDDRFLVAEPPAACLAAVRRAVSSLGWPSSEPTPWTVVATEMVQPASFGNPVRAEIAVGSHGTESVVVIRVTNAGIGPIQRAHVRDRAALLHQRVAAALATPQAEATGGVVGQSASAAAVVVNGEPLGPSGSAALGDRGHGFAPGRYWYDAATGAWGHEGGPTAGFATPGLSLGGPLRADASNGTTGVFINGRQLHAADVAILASLVGMVIPGRYWMDAQGTFGLEGGLPLGNIWAIAAAARAAGSGSGPWSQTTTAGTVGGDGQGFVYFQGHDGSSASTGG
jgi:hypothetical protein